MNQNGMTERVSWWRVEDPGRPELLHATFRTRTFPRHSHERFALGVIEAGALAFDYRGSSIIAPEGQISLAFPGEPHTGTAAGTAGWTYRMFYLDPDYLLEVIQSLNPKCKSLPFVPAGALVAPDLFQRIAKLHRRFENTSDAPVNREVELAGCVLELFCRYSAGRVTATASCGPARSVALARAFIEETYSNPISLDDLAACSGLTRFQLCRAFTNELGIPPHAYLNQVRIRNAARLLRCGVTPIQAAVQVGFADQSHLHRHFLRVFGVTPGVYRKGGSH